MIIIFILASAIVYTGYVAYKKTIKANELQNSLQDKVAINNVLQEHNKKLNHRIETLMQELVECKEKVSTLNEGLEAYITRTKKAANKAKKAKAVIQEVSPEPKFRKRRYTKRKPNK